MISVREIAELAGVSTSTVSLVLNNKPGVSEAMRTRVLNAMNTLNTRKGAPAREKEASYTPGLRGEILSIVVLHPPVMRSSYVFGEVLQGIQAAAERYNVHLRLVVNDPLATAQHVSHLYFTDPNLRPDGVLVFGAKRQELLADEAQRLGIPCVVLGRDAGRYDISGLGRDEERYGRLATEYLISLGHQAIGFIGGDDAYDFVHNRVRGYQKALADADVEGQAQWIQPGEGAIAAHRLFAAAPEVTGVIFVNDTYAAEGLPVIESLGLSIPEDLSVLSFDDTDVARKYHPPLTSISYRRYEEGQWAVKMLIDQIRYPYVERVHTLFNAELIERESCARPRGEMP